VSLIHILDVSAYQPSSVFDTVSDIGIGLVKATEGKSWTSPVFAKQYAGAKSHTKRRGAYHFARPEESSAHDQCSRFLDVVQPVKGEIVMLDLEASRLTQAETNAWARQFGDDLVDQAGNAADWLYMGSGYASNNTGKGLAAHFSRWMYPQYPSAYQLTNWTPYDEGIRRLMNRSSLVPERVLISRLTSKWPPAVTPWLPAGAAKAVGWPDGPDAWQFTDNWKGLDASVSARTLDELAGSGAHPLEDDMYAQASGPPGPPLKVGTRHTYACTKGLVNIWGLVFDSPHKLTYRFALHHQAGGGEVQEVTVGGPASANDSWPKKQTPKTTNGTVDWFSVELVKCEGPTADWDPTQPGADGRTVLPGWDASHTA
jgi:hypothetical protein